MYSIYAGRHANRLLQYNNSNSSNDNSDKSNIPRFGYCFDSIAHVTIVIIIICFPYFINVKNSFFVQSEYVRPTGVHCCNDANPARKEVTQQRSSFIALYYFKSIFIPVFLTGYAQYNNIYTRHSSASRADFMRTYKCNIIVISVADAITRMNDERIKNNDFSSDYFKTIVLFLTGPEQLTRTSMWSHRLFGGKHFLKLSLFRWKRTTLKVVILFVTRTTLTGGECPYA